MKSTKKPVFSLIVVGAMSIACATIVAEPAKCSPCQAAKSVRDELRQSIKDVAAAALAAGGAYSREQELHANNDVGKCAKCGCSSRTTRDELAQIIEKCGCGSRTTRDQLSQDIEKCGCSSRTTRDELSHEIETNELVVEPTVAACCEFCAEPGSLGCQGKNAFRCNTCQQGLIKMSVVEAAQEAVATMEALMEDRLDQITDVSRAPREALEDSCDPCGPTDPGCNSVDSQLRALRCCCSLLTQRVACQGNQARKFYRKLKNKINDVEDQVAATSSATDVLLLSIIDILTLTP